MATLGNAELSMANAESQLSPAQAWLATPWPAWCLAMHVQAKPSRAKLGQAELQSYHKTLSTTKVAMIYASAVAGAGAPYTPSFLLGLETFNMEAVNNLNEEMARRQSWYLYLRVEGIGLRIVLSLECDNGVTKCVLVRGAMSFW